MREIVSFFVGGGWGRGERRGGLLGAKPAGVLQNDVGRQVDGGDGGATSVPGPASNTASNTETS